MLISRSAIHGTEVEGPSSSGVVLADDRFVSGVRLSVGLAATTWLDGLHSPRSLESLSIGPITK
jgi:hypothetical protein